MSNFEKLHPALQHHIVNSLGWRDLRPFQDDVIAPILSGEHLLVLAPTAGGKTEAAFFPLVSRMLAESWTGLSLLYICPIKALLNNLDVRLQRYCTLLGRRSALWHGDVTTGERRHVLSDPPDCLLTTPESLELMLVSPNVDARSLFANLKAVVVDEIHAFAGDDRGWHLLSVMERITRLAGHEVQRIGLSATVGNPDALLDWLVCGRDGQRRVVLPSDPPRADADVQLDYVGSMRNAAVIISRLHRGEKRLVFVDSRARAEAVGSELLDLGVTSFVTHSSLSQEQRREAEHAFANREDCVIVATSVLELGIDVGNLDRVIQIDSPSRVSSFLQRMGRTGRREGATRNCLFLATQDESLLQAAGLIALWATGYVEPVEPPPEPLHVLSQQLLALTLQEGGIGRGEWYDWVRRVPAFAMLNREKVEQIVQWMLEHHILWDEAGILAIGQEGEKKFGFRHFSELLSVFLSPPLVRVLHGRKELGFVDPLTFFDKRKGPRQLLLGGRAWHVTSIDWQRKEAYVEAAVGQGRTRWKGEWPGLRFRLCQAIKEVLVSDDMSSRWSQRACEQVTEIRKSFSWARGDRTAIVTNQEGQARWWTFAGNGANASVVPALAQAAQSAAEHDSLGITFEAHVDARDILASIEEIKLKGFAHLQPSIDPDALDGLKFSSCLPPAMGLSILAARAREPEALKHLMAESCESVSI